jgi:hypothetical protein
VARAGFDTPKALGKAIEKAAAEVRGLDEASAELGATLVALSRRLVPVRQGTLRGSIQFRVGKPPRNIDSKVTVSAGGARAPYAAPIHWGWHRRHIKKNPFLMDALGRLDASGAIEDTYQAKVAEILEKAFR